MKKSLANLLDRRSFFRRSASIGAAVTAAGFVTEGDLEAAMQAAPQMSRPSDLKITDLRIAHVKDAPMRCPLIKLYTNQGIVGLGEVRDGADPRLRTASIAAMSVSTTTVPCTSTEPLLLSCALPETFRPPTSTSLTGLCLASTPREDSALAMAPHTSAKDASGVGGSSPGPDTRAYMSCPWSVYIVLPPDPLRTTATPSRAQASRSRLSDAFWKYPTEAVGDDRT